MTCITLSCVMQVSPEEMKSIMQALMKSNADLAGRGYTGQGRAVTVQFDLRNHHAK